MDPKSVVACVANGCINQGGRNALSLQRRIDPRVGQVHDTCLDVVVGNTKMGAMLQLKPRISAVVDHSQGRHDEEGGNFPR
jgi:hypothetical protein